MAMRLLADNVHTTPARLHDTPAAAAAASALAAPELALAASLSSTDIPVLPEVETERARLCRMSLCCHDGSFIAVGGGLAAIVCPSADVLACDCSAVIIYLPVT